MDNVAIVIPAVKKNAAFTDDLVKKLAGISLVQRALNKAKQLINNQHIYLITDSDEIRLIGQRQEVKTFYKPSLNLNAKNNLPELKFLLLRLSICYKDIIVISPYAPLLEVDILKKSYERYQQQQVQLLIPIRCQSAESGRTLNEICLSQQDNLVWTELRIFQIFNTQLLKKKILLEPNEILYHPINDDLIEIHNHQDWWICEKLLQRKRIVFRVIGYDAVGMGHIYRALSLAHEITDHEIIFVCDTNSTVATNKLAGYDYWLETYAPDEILDKIIELKPSLVINDMLTTKKEDIQKLQAHDIKVVNFEDLGSGATQADLTINELYDKTVITGEKILWGYNYFFVRDEFNNAKLHQFKKTVDAILLTFGGTDQNDLSRSIYRAIKDYCQQHNIKIYIVTGGGYPYYEAFKAEIKQDSQVYLTHATGVMSHIMEQTQLAITSNGRTVYELAHMNIPSIVISQHDREKTHGFACLENGFIPIDVYQAGITEKKVLALLTDLIEKVAYRKRLFECTKSFNFCNNKQHVLTKIIQLLEPDNQKSI